MKDNQSFTRIRKQLQIIAIVSVLIVISFVAILKSQFDQVMSTDASLSEIINLSGRQRMLSQSITKEILLLNQGAEMANIHRQRVDSLNKLLATSHTYLVERIEKDDQILQALFKDIEPHYDELRKIAQKCLTDGVSNEDISRLLKEESAYLPIMNQITKEFELRSTDIIDDIKIRITFFNYAIGLAVLITAGVVLLITLRVIKSYAIELDAISKQLNAALKREYSKVQRFEFLVKTLNVGIWENSLTKGEQRWSNQLYQMLGYEPNEIKGSAGQFLKHIDTNEQKQLLDACQSSLVSGIPSTVEVRMRKKSGEYIWVEATGNAQKNNENELELLIGGVIEITSRKVLELQLKAFTEHAPAAIAMFNMQMEYLAVSDRWVSDYGLDGKSLIGISHYDIFPEIGEHWKGIHQRCLNGSVETNEEDPFERLDGTIQYIKWEVRPWYQNNDQVGGILMFSEDVTQAKKEKKELEQAKSEAEIASRAKEDFLSVMSHEIRTPLNAINGIAEILAIEDPREDQLEHIKLLQFSGDNLLGLINDILDISKIGSGKLELANAPFHFRNLLINIKKTLEYKARENLVTIKTKWDNKLPDGFVGDESRISQIMYNLVGNAIKFTQNGDVTIATTYVDHDDGRYSIRVGVKDNGIGIDPKNHQMIFDSFKQAEHGAIRPYGGTGLGLFITRKLLQMMDSEIHVTSELGKGSEFYFYLNLPKTEVDLQPIVDLDHQIDSNEDRKIFVLIAEDNKANQMIVTKYLEQKEIGFDIAQNGKEALQRVEKKCYDLILMDLQMPEMDGYTATKQIRALDDPYFKNIPIIAITAHAFQEVREKTITAGMNDYLSKPFKRQDLYQVINRNLGKVIAENPSKTIKEIIELEADGDQAFIEEFAGQCKDNYTEFLVRLKSAVKNRDYQELKHITHKIEALNRLFNFDTLQQSINALKETNEDFYNKKEAITTIMSQTNHIIEELKTLIS